VVGTGHLTFAGFDGSFGLSFGLAITFAPLVTLAVRAVLFAIAHILHLAVAVGAPRPVTVAALVVALAAVIFAGRESLTLATRGSASATGGAFAATATLASLAALSTALGALTTGAVPARVEAPRCRGRGACPLHLIC
jgi:hypothetical protein